MDGKVISISGKEPAQDKEREFVDFFAQRLREYVEDYGHLPEVFAFAIWGSDGSDGTDWSTSYMCDPPKSKVEAQSIAAGLLLTKDL